MHHLRAKGQSQCHSPPHPPTPRPHHPFCMPASRWPRLWLLLWQQHSQPPLPPSSCQVVLIAPPFHRLLQSNSLSSASVTGCHGEYISSYESSLSAAPPFRLPGSHSFGGVKHEYHLCFCGEVVSDICVRVLVPVNLHVVGRGVLCRGLLLVTCLPARTCACYHSES